MIGSISGNLTISSSQDLDIIVQFPTNLSVVSVQFMAQLPGQGAGVFAVVVDAAGSVSFGFSSSCSGLFELRSKEYFRLPGPVSVLGTFESTNASFSVVTDKSFVSFGWVEGVTGKQIGVTSIEPYLGSGNYSDLVSVGHDDDGRLLFYQGGTIWNDKGQLLSECTSDAARCFLTSSTCYDLNSHVPGSKSNWAGCLIYAYNTDILTPTKAMIGLSPMNSNAFGLRLKENLFTFQSSSITPTSFVNGSVVYAISAGYFTVETMLQFRIFSTAAFSFSKNKTPTPLLTSLTEWTWVNLADGCYPEQNTFVAMEDNPSLNSALVWSAMYCSATGPRLLVLDTSAGGGTTVSVDPEVVAENCDPLVPSTRTCDCQLQLNDFLYVGCYA